jgi:hypothetical protein
MAMLINRGLYDDETGLDQLSNPTGDASISGIVEFGQVTIGGADTGGCFTFDIVFEDGKSSDHLEFTLQHTGGGGALATPTEGGE